MQDRPRLETNFRGNNPEKKVSKTKERKSGSYLNRQPNFESSLSKGKLKRSLKALGQFVPTELKFKIDREVIEIFNLSGVASFLHCLKYSGEYTANNIIKILTEPMKSLSVQFSSGGVDTKFMESKYLFYSMSLKFLA